MKKSSSRKKSEQSVTLLGVKPSANPTAIELHLLRCAEVDALHQQIDQLSQKILTLAKRREVLMREVRGT